MLGLALGDAIGAKRSDVPLDGTLAAGAATQLAAWTAEGLLRCATRYGGRVVGNPFGALQGSYQRWAALRGASPAPGVRWHTETDHPEYRGWLIDVPAMAHKRGSSPSTLKAIRRGHPVDSSGCQGMLRVLPLAAFALTRDGHRQRLDAIDRDSRALVGITHANQESLACGGFATRLLAEALLESGSLQDAVGRTMADCADRDNEPRIQLSWDLGTSEPCVPGHLERLAPKKTASSALAGGLYVALSFPDADTVAEAVEFAGWAPNGDSVAAVAGALLGALHGYEALPVPLAARLELGWVMDQLGRDLAAQVAQNQAGEGWKSQSPDPCPPLDPWWDTRYPGV